MCNVAIINIFFQNTTDEDSMVVQYILAVRKGRRDLRDIQKLQPMVTGDQPNDGQEENGSDKGEEKENKKTDEYIQAPTTAAQQNQESTSDLKLPSEQLDGQNKLVEVEEYYVKYRNFSYLHCEWKTEDELYKGDKRIAAKLKRFKQKMAHHANIFENVSLS